MFGSFSSMSFSPMASWGYNLYNNWSTISSINFSSSGTQYGCTVGDYLSTANSYGVVGRDIGRTTGVVLGGAIGGFSSGGLGVITGAGAGAGIGAGIGYGVGAGIGLGSKYNECYY